MTYFSTEINKLYIVFGWAENVNFPVWASVPNISHGVLVGIPVLGSIGKELSYTSSCNTHLTSIISATRSEPSLRLFPHLVHYLFKFTHHCFASYACRNPSCCAFLRNPFGPGLGFQTGCWPNAILHPLLCDDSDSIGFGVFALQDFRPQILWASKEVLRGHLGLGMGWW